MARDLKALKELYTRVFLGQEDYIPLLVGVPCPGGPGWEALWHDTRNAVAQAVRAMQPHVAVADDWFPTQNIGYWQNVVVPGLYGAEVIVLKGSEPICKPRFRTVQEAVDAGVPAVEGPGVERMIEMLRAARSALPEGYFVSMPPVSSPFDLAQLLLGEEFLIALHEEPEALQKFLSNLTELVLALTHLAKREQGWGTHEYITNRGLFFPGLRQPCDAIVNLSPAHLRTFALPVFERLGRAFGALCIHYCTRPAPSSHVLPVLTETPWVRAVDNWQGIDAFIGPQSPARLQDRVALVSDVDLSTPAKMDAFLARPEIRDVPRRGGRGLVVSSWAPDVETARTLYAEWQKRVGR